MQGTTSCSFPRVFFSRQNYFGGLTSKSIIISTKIPLEFQQPCAGHLHICIYISDVLWENQCMRFRCFIAPAITAFLLFCQIIYYIMAMAFAITLSISARHTAYWVRHVFFCFFFQILFGYWWFPKYFHWSSGIIQNRRRDPTRFNSLWPSDTIWRQVNWLIIGPGDGLVPNRRQAIT